MTTSTIEIAVEDIQQGDEFVDADGYHHWTATADAVTGDGPPGFDAPLVTVAVQFRDGGGGFRAWDPGEKIEVRR